jgi:catechol 2,3-dioxygenase-like lactoylglutathione lyase family enzyme
MNVRRIVPNIPSDRIEESRAFYTELLGLNVAMDMGWVVTLVSPNYPTAQISLLQKQEQSAAPTLSVEVDDVDSVHADAVERGLPIVYPLTTEPWGVRRFFVIDPNGVVINVMGHVK